MLYASHELLFIERSLGTNDDSLNNECGDILTVFRDAISRQFWLCRLLRQFSRNRFVSFWLVG